MQIVRQMAKSTAFTHDGLVLWNIHTKRDNGDYIIMLKIVVVVAIAVANH